MTISGFALILAALWAVGRVNFLLFHTLAEFFAVLVAWSLFIILWNTRSMVENKALVVMGIAYLFVGIIDLTHTLSYSGMNLLGPERGADPATQLWILARYIESITLLVFPFLFFKSVHPLRVFGVYSFITVAGILAILYWEIFPVCYIDGTGLTVFKKASEYLICLILASALMVLRKKKSLLDPFVYRFIAVSIVLTIFAELAFTFYVDVYGLSNLIGHFLKIMSFYFIYLALVRSGLTRPHFVLFNRIKESEERYRSLIDFSPLPFLVTRDERIVFVNPAVLDFLGIETTEDVIDTRPDDWIHPDYAKLAGQRRLQVLEKGGTAEAVELALIRKDGREMTVLANTSRILHDGSPALLSAFQDITDRKQAEKEREKLQEQLNQARKMESVGRLAGGVAHDFNNMLTVILGYTQAALEDVHPSEPLYSSLREILNAARRSADLTRQLLTFARKQIINPRVLNLNRTVEQMTTMLERLISEHIDLVWRPCRSLWNVKMDPLQVHQILVNLCVNAGDAISGPGRITIETANKHIDPSDCKAHPGFIPGDYVLLEVRDNGCGMSGDILENLFEPFYTTKDVGSGTGLGLPMVYGIVRQNKGFIHVESEPGRGTDFRIYLPRYEAACETAEIRPVNEPPPRGGESVLLVEDEPAILKMIRMMLVRLGYNVIEAPGPLAALELVNRRSESVRLLLTDVIMPEMNGRDLAEKIHESHPEMKCLFMSGYPADIIARHGVPDGGVEFIRKPFSRAELAVKLRDLLDKDDVRHESGSIQTDR